MKKLLLVIFSLAAFNAISAQPSWINQEKILTKGNLIDWKPNIKNQQDRDTLVYQPQLK